MDREMLLHCEARRVSADWWVAQCLEIAVVSQGRSLSEARSDLEDCLRLHFKDVHNLKAAGHQVPRIRPVPWYGLRLVLWSYHYWRARARHSRPEGELQWAKDWDYNLVHA